MDNPWVYNRKSKIIQSKGKGLNANERNQEKQNKRIELHKPRGMRPRV
jgi:hypothetical protein